MVTALSIKVNEDGSKDFIFDERIIEMFGNDKESLMKFVDVLEQKEVKLSQEETNRMKEETKHKIEETNKIREQTKQMGFKNMENIIMAGCNTINNVLEGIKEIKRTLNENEENSDNTELLDDRTDEEVADDINKNFVWAKET